MGREGLGALQVSEYFLILPYACLLWRLQVGKGQWERVKEMVTRIRALDMEVCTTMGMLTPEQAAELRTAGLSAYNHNLDTSEEHYAKITTTRRYQDRLDTLEVVRNAGISVCAGGIIGLGEGIKDRAGLLLTVSQPSALMPYNTCTSR